MKRVLQVLAVLLSVGAMGQTVFNYKRPARIFNADVEQEKLLNLLNDVNSEDREFKKDEIVEQTMQYLKSIDADGNLRKFLDKKCQNSEMKPETPGI